MKRQRGLTLVELMVAIVLALFVTNAAIALLLANRRTAASTTSVGAISDNGRFALNLIGNSVRSAGYMACNALNAAAGAIPQPALTTQLSTLAAGATPVQNNYGGAGTAFAGYEASGTGAQSSSSAATVVAMPVTADTNSGHWANAGGLDALLTANSSTVPGVLNGTDVLVVREQLPQTVTMYTTAAYTAGQLTVTVNDAGSLAGLPLPHAAVVSTCGASVATKITAVAGTVLAVSNLTVGFPSGTSVAPVDTLIYYIGPGRDGDGALFVWDDGSNGTTPFSTELVPDVEGMQVLYGVAPAVPNQVTFYETADAVAAGGQFNQVISVKIALLLASPPGTLVVPVPTTAPTYQLLTTTVTAPKDGRLRQVFDATITARNASL